MAAADDSGRARASTSSAKLQYLIEAEFPAPLAIEFARLRATRDSRAAGPIAGNALGHLLRYLTFVLSAEFLAREHAGDVASELRTAIREHFAQPRSHGQLLGLARRLAGAVASEGPVHPAGRIAAFLGDRTAAARLDAAIALRNRVLKKGGVEAGDELKRAVVELAGALVFLREFPLVRVVSARERAGAQLMEIDFLVGHGEAASSGRLESDLALRPDRVYLLDPVSRTVIDLHPLYVCDAAGRLSWLVRAARAPEYERGDGDAVRRPELAGDLAEVFEQPERRPPLQARFLSLRGDARDPGQRRLAPGDLVDGRFRVIELIAEGGMAQVYEVVDGDDPAQPRLALKLLPYEYIRDRSMLVRFRREATHTAAFRHPHVMPCLHCGEETGDHYLVMPLAAGWAGRRDLSQLALPLPVDEAVDIAMQIADGLAYVHDLGVIHRDLKPRNVLLDGERRVRLTDFGVARTGDAMALTMTGISLGTPEYVAPEQVDQLEGDGVGPETDIYSFGAVLFELLTGRPPFTGASPLAVMHAAATRPVPNPRRLRPEIPGQLAGLVKECLARDPATRPSARTLYNRLASFGSTALETDPETEPEPEPTPEPTPTPEPEPEPARGGGLGRGPAALIAALLLLAGATAASIYILRGSPAPAIALPVAVEIPGDITITASPPRPAADVALPRAKWMPAQLVAESAELLGSNADSLSMMYLSRGGTSLSATGSQSRLASLWKDKRRGTWKLGALLAERSADEERLRRHYRGFEEDPAQRLRLDQALAALSARTQPRLDELIERDRALRGQLLIQLQAMQLDLTDAGLFLLGELLYERAQDVPETERDHAGLVAALDRLVERFPDSELRAPALYLRAYTLQESATTDDDRARAAAAFLHLAYQHPDAEVTQQAYVRAAEHFFTTAEGPADLRKAERAYRWLVESTAPAARPLRRPALFKLGWTELRLGSAERAADAFCRALTPAPDGAPALAADHPLERAAEAGLALALVLRQVEPARIEIGCREGDCICRPGVVAELARHHTGLDQPEDAETLYRTWLTSFPTHADAPALHCELTRLLEDRGRLDDAAAEREAMGQAYAPGSDWAAINAWSLGKGDVVDLTDCTPSGRVPATGPVPPIVPAEAARTAAEGRTPGFTHCYRSALLGDPRLSGRLSLTLTLDPAGAVIGAEPDGPGLPAGLVQCVASVAHRIHFSGLGEPAVRLTLRFTPAP